MRALAAAVLAVALAGCASTHSITPQVAGGDVVFARAQAVEVKLSSYHFDPNPVRLKAGQPYALKLVNAASKDHTFTAPEFFAAAKVAPADAQRIAGGQIELKPGAATVLHLVPAAGEYGLVCTEVGHAALGMHAKIIVG